MKKLGALLLLLLLLTGCGSKPPQGKYLCTDGLFYSQIEVKGRKITITNLRTGSSATRKLSGKGPSYRMDNGNYAYWNGVYFSVSESYTFINFRYCEKQ